MNSRPTARWRLAVALALPVLAAPIAPAANLTPISVTGFNWDVVVENTAAGPPFSGYASELRPGENLSFYQSDLAGKSYGLPVSGSFTSAVGDGTTFQFQPYTANNAVVLSSTTGLTAGTLKLVAPATYSRIAVLANSSGGGGTANLTLNFTDGSTFTTNYNAPDWYNNTGFALQGVERINLTTGATSGAPTNPRFYQTTLDLASLLGTANKPLASLTFNKVASAGSTGIYAVSGEVAPELPAAIGPSPTNLVVNEASPATFSAGVTGNPLPALQWFRGSAALDGATNSSYTLASAALGDSGAVFQLVASNFANSVSAVVTSAPATLTVLADTNRPVLLGAQSFGLNQVLTSFSERLLPATATNTAHFVLTGTNGSLPVSGLALEASQTNVLLTVATMTEGAAYTLTVNSLADQSAGGNIIASNSQATFTASVYAAQSIGNPTPAGSQVVVANGINLSGGGADVGGSSDQCQFSWLQRTGDFDVLVRLDSLTLADAWSEAGMQAREDLSPGARSVSVLATPSISGCYFQARGTTNGATTLSGSWPVNYPNTWLRLKRAGNDFTGFAGFDGVNWAQLGTANLTLPATVFFGFAVSSHNTSQLATAAFRDFSDVTNAGVAAPIAFEPLGQCSRRTSLVISEIMYHPTNTALEFVEVFNSRGEPADLGGYRIGGSVGFTFPAGTTLPGGGFLVVAKSPADLQSAYGISGVFGPFTGSLPNDAGTVTLVNQSGGVFLQVDYTDHAPWPVSADGAGHSLVLARASFGENNPLAWAASDSVGGSPGRLDPFTPDPLRDVVINEFLAHTDLPDYDYIELYNHSAQPADVSGCVLTDDASTNKFALPPGTILPPHGFVACTEVQLGFALDAAGETIFFKNAARTRVLDAVRFEAQENGVATGRFPDGADQFYRLAAKTPGTNNAVLLVSDVVINELMYHPISQDADDQYIELFNRGAAPANLTGWTLGGAVSFNFPSNTVLAPNGYLVVARFAAHLMTNYANLNAANTVGDFNGKLSGKGERLVLMKPDTIVTTNGSGVVATNLIHIPVDELSYGTGGQWLAWADGGGSSLELTDPHSNHRLPSNWADSDETHKAPWSLVSATGTIDNGSSTADQLQLLLQGAGECLVDNVQVLTSAGSNLIANSTFETDATGWTAEGTESPSSLETSEGYASTKSYHIRAVDRGDNQVNRIRTPLTSSLASGTLGVTIRANVRWLKGDPGLLLRLRGNWLECAGRMALPVSPGTPGARNSRYITNAPPAFTEVRHSPTLPQAAQPILITARVQDPDSISAVQVFYRIDPATSYSTVTMTDDGTGGDAIAGDGVFSATIPGLASGSMLAFYVRAADLFTPPAAANYPSDAPVRECLVRVGEVQPTGNFPVYRIWMTQATLNTWTSRNKLDNSPFNVTFVLGDDRVIQCAQALYAGSPYIAPGYCGPACGRCAYTITVPPDDLFLGETDLVLDWPGGHGGETSAMQEEMGYWIADRMNLPFSHRYIIRLHVNGVTDDARSAVFEAVQQPAKGFLAQWSPAAPGGAFFKIDRAFEFTDAGSLSTAPEPRLQVFTTTGGLKKREKYRWNFMYRGADDPNNYTNIFALADALNATAPEPYTSATLGLVDVEQWMGIFAVEHIVVNFDAYGHEIGKNMYAFLPEGGKWQLYLFDLDWLMLAAPLHIASYAASTAPLFNSEDPTIATMYGFPPFARAYYRAVQNAVNNAFDPALCNPVMDAKYASLRANGIAWCDGKALTDPTVVKTWFSDRRTALQTALAPVSPAFTVNPSVTLSNGIGLVSGLAPIGVKTVSINGALWPVRWTTVTNWTASVPLATGSNYFSVVGVDLQDQAVAGASNAVSVVYSNSVPSPAGAVVINEIMFNPLLPDAEYVELFNASTNFTYDLAGWELNGLAYTFPNGAFIGPRGYLVLAKDRTAFDMAYGSGVTVFDQFSGNLQSDGETLSLIKPAAAPATNDVVVDRVRYEAAAPWAVTGGGKALQLVDAAQDNARVANWAVGQTNTPTAPQWVFVSATGVPRPSGTQRALYIYLQSAGDIYIDDLTVVSGSQPAVGTNLATNGGFESVLSPWTIGSDGNNSSSAISTTVKHSGNSSLHLVASAGGSSQNSSIWQNFSPSLTVGGTYTLSYWFLQTTNGGPLTVRFANNGITTTTNPAPPVAATSSFFTPGASNSITAVLAPFPPLWLNELQADNISGPLDNAGQRDPWVELYNAGPTALSLSNYFLSDTYTNLAKWAFPSNAVVPAGSYLVVWCDNQTSQTVAGAPHTSFRLGSGAGNVALSRWVSNAVQLVDYLNYTNVPANWSYGDLPDGQPFYRDAMFAVTPGATNSPASSPLTVFINEWMADNTRTLADPADGDFEDWFELFNPGTNTVDLGGYFLTDTLTNRFQFEIPANGRYRIPPHGYLLVWADNETKQNSTNRADLHVNFKLDKAGEAIGLFGADGTLIDAVTFGPQITDLSAGRYPDGSANIAFLPAATPLINNLAPNTPPALAPIASRVVAAGQLVAFRAYGSDTEAPPQTLAYSLGLDAPPGATISAASGQFTWTPTNAPATNLLSVLVADNGVPSLSATQSFTVTVLAAPQLASARIVGSQFVFTCPTVADQTYQVETSDDLSPGSWALVGAPFAGTGAPVVVTNVLESTSSQFFRVRVLP